MLRTNRDEAAVQKALAAITECVKTKQGNLLELAVEAAKVRASLGEISDACEVVVGRYKAVIRSISGVYSSEVKNDKSFERACSSTTSPASVGMTGFFERSSSTTAITASRDCLRFIIAALFLFKIGRASCRERV